MHTYCAYDRALPSVNMNASHRQGHRAPLRRSRLRCNRASPLISVTATPTPTRLHVLRREES